MKQEVYQA